jgi:hypothetical protein
LSSVLPSIKHLLANSGQEHVLQYWDELDTQSKAKLLKQIESIDFDLFSHLVESTRCIENKTSEIIGKAMSSPFGVGNAHFRTGQKDGLVDTVAFGAYRKEVFESVGYFDEDLARNQDDEFNYRLLKNNFKIYLSKKIISSYYVRASFKNLFRQYFQYGFWKVYVNKKHRTITTLRQLIPSLMVSTLILGFVFSFLNMFFALLFATEIILYLIGSCWFASKKANNLKQLFAIIFTFLILHTSYGIGYLYGVLKFEHILIL